MSDDNQNNSSQGNPNNDQLQEGSQQNPIQNPMQPGFLHPWQQMMLLNHQMLLQQQYTAMQQRNSQQHDVPSLNPMVWGFGDPQFADPLQQGQPPMQQPPEHLLVPSSATAPQDTNPVQHAPINNPASTDNKSGRRTMTSAESAKAARRNYWNLKSGNDQQPVDVNLTFGREVSVTPSESALQVSGESSCKKRAQKEQQKVVSILSFQQQQPSDSKQPTNLLNTEIVVAGPTQLSALNKRQSAPCVVQKFNTNFPSASSPAPKSPSFKEYHGFLTYVEQQLQASRDTVTFQFLEHILRSDFGRVLQQHGRVKVRNMVDGTQMKWLELCQDFTPEGQQWSFGFQDCCWQNVVQDFVRHNPSSNSNPQELRLSGTDVLFDFFMRCGMDYRAYFLPYEQGQVASGIRHETAKQIFGRVCDLLMKNSQYKTTSVFAVPGKLCDKERDANFLDDWGFETFGGNKSIMVEVLEECMCFLTKVLNYPPLLTPKKVKDLFEFAFTVLKEETYATLDKYDCAEVLRKDQLLCRYMDIIWRQLHDIYVSFKAYADFEVCAFFFWYCWSRKQCIDPLVTHTRFQFFDRE